MMRILPRTAAPARRPLAVVAFLLLPLATAASATAQPGPSDPPPPDPNDVESVDAILTAVYASISGPAGEPRDRERFRSLFMPGARLIPTYGNAGEGYARAVWSPEEYIDRAGGGLERDGFFEREIHRVQERFGPLVHAFSTYESRRSEADPEPFARGINSFQLFWDGSRWWVASILWYGETPEHPIPSEYVGTPRPGAR